MTELNVYFRRRRVGRALSDDLERFSFLYDDEWLRYDRNFPISLRLPLHRRRWPAAQAHPFFANLLPEGASRQAICRRLGISVDNDVALLAAIGDDTAGALRFITNGGIPELTAPTDPIPILEDDLRTWSEGAPTFVTEPAQPPRLSLAGAQHKVGVVLDDQSNYCIAASGQPSTHLLKFDARDYPHLASNEFLTTRLASALGLEVVKMKIDDFSPRPFLVIDRYDRIPIAGPSGEQILRLHQEDFCQVRGVVPTQKYEIEGGPMLAEIAESIRSYSSTPAKDLLRLARWAIFCALCGNADGHAKNLSLVYSPHGLRLAPFYDLVCTRAFEGLAPSLAMAIGGERNSDRLRLHHFHDLATGLGIQPRKVESEVSRMLANVDDAFARASAELEQAVGFSPAVERVERAIQKRVRAIGNNLKQDRE